jgi:hypothetical protein
MKQSKNYGVRLPRSPAPKFFRSGIARNDGAKEFNFQFIPFIIYHSLALKCKRTAAKIWLQIILDLY